MLAAVVLLWSDPAPAASDGQKEYLKGVRSYESKQFEAAVRSLRVALAEDPKEGLRKVRTTGVAFEDYFPHYYLGLCLNQLGRNEEASRELQESDRQGVISERMALYKTLASLLPKLQATLLAEAQPSRPAPNTPPAPTRPPPPPAPTALPLSPPTPGPPQRPIPTEPPATPTPPAPRETPVKATPTKSAPISTPPPVQTPRGVLHDPTPIRSAPSLSPEELATAREGVRLFFRGRFDEAVSRLEKPAEKLPGARFILACSLANLYVLSGNKDSKLLDRARKEYALARSAGARPDDHQYLAPGLTDLLTSP